MEKLEFDVFRRWKTLENGAEMSVWNMYRYIRSVSLCQWLCMWAGNLESFDWKTAKPEKKDTVRATTLN